MKKLYHSFLIPTILVFFLFCACKKKSSPDDDKVHNITISPTSLNIAKSETIIHQLVVSIDGTPVQPYDVKWSTLDDKIAMVSDKGYVTGKGKGETEIVVNLVNGKGAAKCKVTVYDEYAYKYRLVLKDKGPADFSLASPEKFLSSKAIARRIKRNIAISTDDLPISADYISQIKKIGGIIVAKSKWLNTITIYSENELVADEYRKLPFVKSLVTVWQGKKGGQLSNHYQDTPVFKVTTPPVNNLDSGYYGSAWNNIHINNGETLHKRGFKGEGIDIAVIDAGFKELKNNSSLHNINIKGAKSFIYEDANPYNMDSHGVWVTSCMATDRPGYYVGTAPNANYWLLRTEVEATEYPVEEDYWVSAIEYADSLGVDVVNTSLSYTQFSDLNSISYTYGDMNGKTAFASRAVEIAVKKGIFVVCSAGNDHSWVGTPGEAPNVLAIGSVNRTGTVDVFSSFGITIDGRIKPDVLALGGGASVIDVNGNSTYKNGTSYASPILCGLAACLWQAYPKLDNNDLLNIFRKVSDKYTNPVVPYGYGIPDMQKAMLLAAAISATK